MAGDFSMKLIFLGDYLKGLYRLIVLLIIIVLIIPKVFFLVLDFFGDDTYIESLYEVSITEEEKEVNYFNKVWLDIKEFYIYGF